MGKKAELKLLKSILWLYIILCVIIAGLNYGYASHATPEVSSFITWFWHFYENQVKTLFILIGSYLTLKIVSKDGTMRKRNLIGFICAALVVHIMGPLALNNSELYFFTMPIPWSSTGLQLLSPDSSFYLSRVPVWGVAGMTTAFIFYICASMLIIVGTLLFGRQWQCSTLCLFNGFAAEVFDPAIPLVGKKRLITPKKLKTLNILRWVFLFIGFFFTFYWVLVLFGVPLSASMKMMGEIESFKYLLTELFVAMFFWIAFIGRGYCYYCPLGTVLAYISKISGQKIRTTNTNCIGCNSCNRACPMAIEIKENAEKGTYVSNIRCVGCGHCVDACPTKTLSYSTKFLDRKR